MIKCPTCKRQAAPKARYCPACYTVFSSDSLAINRRGGGRSDNGIGWTVPYLFFVAILVAWFLSIDAGAWNAEPGSYGARSRDLKRQMIYWFGQSTGLGQGSTNEEERPVQRPDVLRPNERPAWSIANDNQLPCARGATCKVVIDFHSGNSASYLIERPYRGTARIIAVDSLGADLLGKSTGAQLVVPKAGRISISRTMNGWSIVDGRRLSAANTRAGQASANEGVGP